MKVELTRDEVATILYNSFCNGGLSLLSSSGLEFDYSDEDYEECRAKLSNPCMEDVFKQMLLDGKRLYFVDVEGDNEEFDLTLEKAQIGLQNPLAATDVLASLAEDGDDDAVVCYDLIQWALFNELIYG